MKAREIYAQLEKDFIKPGITDDFYDYMAELEPFLCENFRIRSIGLICDFTANVKEVYTAVFPSENALTKVLEKTEDAVVFLHHACIWDLKKSAHGFYNIDARFFEELKTKRVSLYCLHHPLDNFSEYSTSKTLADILGIEVIRPFIEFCGAVCGIIGKTNFKTINDLQRKYSEVVGHETKLYKYGENEIKNNLVAVCAGGGNQPFVIQELIENNINVLVTGITLKNDRSATAHELGENNQISILGGTHYSSEKFACMEMCKYFNKFGLKAEFIDDEPCFEDL